MFFIFARHVICIYNYNILYITYIDAYKCYSCIDMDVCRIRIYTLLVLELSHFQLVQSSLLALGTLGTKMLIGKLLRVKDDVCRQRFPHFTLLP